MREPLPSSRTSAATRRLHRLLPVPVPALVPVLVPALGSFLLAAAIATPAAAATAAVAQAASPATAAAPAAPGSSGSTGSTAGATGAAKASSAATAARPVRIASLNPSGRIEQLGQIVLKLASDGPRAGDPQAADPLGIECDGRPVRGAGHWNGPREWVFDPASSSGAPAHCVLRTKPAWRSATGQPIEPREVTVIVGALRLGVAAPWNDGAIDEGQVFVVRANTAVDPAEFYGHATCTVQGIGERIALVPVRGPERDTVLNAVLGGDDSPAGGDGTVGTGGAATGVGAGAGAGGPAAARAADPARDPQRLFTFRCARALPAATPVSLQVPASLASRSGHRLPEAWSAGFTVRPPFMATMTCERERAQSPCIPVRPLTLGFSAPVDAARLKGVVLIAGDRRIEPKAPSPSDATADEPTLQFPGPLPENAALRIELPAGLVDDAGRPLSNAAQFPLAVRTGPMPALVKFSTQDFGVVERHAEGPSAPALLPVTLRRFDADGASVERQVRIVSPTNDDDIRGWIELMRGGAASGSRTRDELTAAGLTGLPVVRPAPVVRNADGSTQPAPDAIPEDRVEMRAVSLLQGLAAAKTTPMPASRDAGSQAEVVGLELPPGFHVLEVASKVLGESLLSTQYATPRTMYVRTSVLVTNLNVHLKKGQDGSVAWVTRLDDGTPVADAQVRVARCTDARVALVRTGADGVARFSDASFQPAMPQPGAGAALPPPPLAGERHCWRERLFVTARAGDDLGVVDSDWSRGIEGWRWGGYAQGGDADGSGDDDASGGAATAAGGSLLAHTVFDRGLYRAGETVSMKHVLRELRADALASSPWLPQRVVLTHEGSGDEVEIPLKWAPGALSAESRHEIARSAKLGTWTVSLQSGEGDARRTEPAGRFRVEEFRLPAMSGTIGVPGDGPVVGRVEVPVHVALNYTNGGAAAGLGVQVSAMVMPHEQAHPQYPEFRFDAPQPPADPRIAADRAARAAAAANDDAATGDDVAANRTDGATVVAHRIPLKLDAHGQADTQVRLPRAADGPRRLVVEASYPDPNGDVQTISASRIVWPSRLNLGIRTEGWVVAGSPLRFQVVALDTDEHVAANVPVEVRATARRVQTTRKRMVGGFYHYDSTMSDEDAGVVCQGRTDDRGLLVCDGTMPKTPQAGAPTSWLLTAAAQDADGRASRTQVELSVASSDEQLWFGGDDSDRMDVLPDRTDYRPGEPVRLQVRMPFREATALVTVERDGVLEHHVQTLSGRNPVVELKAGPTWGPNVFVSVVALRGRLHEVPWYSFFQWGWRSPAGWWRAWRNPDEGYREPTALVDLSKPAFRIGIARVAVGLQDHALKVTVTPDKSRYQTRETARVRVAVQRPDGRPAAAADVALVAVDEALLELSPNRSWDVLRAMYPARTLAVDNATAMQEVVGRRHYGRKLVPAGGDGGAGLARRELLDTLLVWKGRVPLDAKGEAVVDVPVNDSLTGFRIVAVAADGTTDFGTGQASIVATRDLQVIAGLPPLSRGGDRFDARATVRNGSERTLDVTFSARADGVEPFGQTFTLAPGAAQELLWPVGVPNPATGSGVEREWTLAATSTVREAAANDARRPADSVRFVQKIESAVPVTVRQAQLARLEGRMDVDVQAAPDALDAAGGTSGIPVGGVRIAVQPTLTHGLPAVRGWFERYPYACLEQRTSKSIGLADDALWQRTVADLGTYLDRDGLASYYPVGPTNRMGYDHLTAYILSASDEARRRDPRFALPDAARDRMLDGLQAWVEGRIERSWWMPKNGLTERKITAMEALSRYGRVTAPMVATLRIDPGIWPTHVLLDWVAVLTRTPKLPQRDARLADAWQQVRSRLGYSGRRIGFGNDARDGWWWLMQNTDVNVARLMLLAMDQPGWKDDLPRMVVGFLDRQQGGAWSTTTANLWGGLALDAFARQFEREPVTGTLRARLADAAGSPPVPAGQPPVAASPASQPQGAQPQPGPSPTAQSPLPLPQSGQSPAPASPAAPEPRQAAIDWANVRAATPESRPDPKRPRAAAPPAGAWTGNTALLPWLSRGASRLELVQDGTGTPWVTTEFLAAVRPDRPVRNGYTIRKTLVPVVQAQKGRYTRGDVVRVRLDVDAAQPMTWVVLSDPVPGGATLLESGLARDSKIEAGAGAGAAGGAAAADGDGDDASGDDALSGGWDAGRPAFVERTFGAWRGYFNYLGKGRSSVEYVVRLGTTGHFEMPVTRIEAMYAPEVFGELPNAAIDVRAAQP